MAWTAEKVKAMRESNPSKAAESSGWTAEKVRAIRTKTPNPSAASSTVSPKSNIYADALQQYAERHASDMGEVDARNEPSQALRASSPKGGATGVSGKFPLDAGSSAGRKMAGAATEGSGIGPAQQMPGEAARALDMGQKWGVPAKSGNVLEDAGSGATAYGTSPAQELRASFAKDSVPDEFDRINQWLDTGDNKNLADAVRRVDSTHGAYTDADLIQKGGWTQAQIDEARKMNAALDAIPAWQRGVRRTANTIGGIGDTVAAAPVLGAEYGVQAGKNIDATLKNWKQVEQEVKGDEHAKSLFDLLTDVDMDYNPTWPESRNRELISMGYNSKEIREMRQKLAGLEVSDGIDKNQSVGYQLYDRGQQLTAAAQSGLSPTQRAVAGAVTSAAENLAVAAGGDGVAWILPMLSAQGAAEAMGQSAEKGESAGKALGGAVGTGLHSMSEGLDRATATTANEAADGSADRAMAGGEPLTASVSPAASALRSSLDRGAKNQGSLTDSAAGREMAGLATERSDDTNKVTVPTKTERYSLQTDAKGKKYIQIDSDILDGVAPEAQMRVVRDAIRDLFPNGFERDGKHIDNTREGRGEFVRSKYTRGLEKAAPETHADKMRMAANLDEIIQNTEDVRNEAAVHNNAESFNRGKINVRIGANSYSADVLTAIKNDGREVAYDVVNIQPTTIEAPEGNTSEASGSSRGTIASSAETDDRGHPGTPLDLSTETTTQQSVGSESGETPKTNIAPEDGVVNAPLRETLGLRPEAPKTQREAEVQRALEGWRVTDKAAETISKNMPDKVDTDRYAAAASPLYRLGRSGAATFAQALELAGSMNGTAADINYILSTDAGRTALEIAYTQGKGERMLYAEKMTELGGALGSESTSGKGEVYAKGTMRQEGDAASQIISLNAAATGTDAVLYNVLQNDPGVRAYVDTETARIFFGDNAQDIFGTVLHEDYHWYNALDAEGARTLQEHALEYLAKSSGYESLDEMIRAKLEDYSAQSLTYEQAAEELVADAWRGIFDSEESFKRWVTFQRGQAEKNAGKSGTIHKVMEQVRQMLDGLISRAKEVLTIDPDDRAALKAKRLAEAEKRTLQDEYFAHAEKAMDNLREAKENAAALKTESAAEKQGVRFQLHEGKDSLEEQMNKNINELEKMHIVATVNGDEVAFGKNNSESIENIEKFFDSIGNKAIREGFGTVELLRKGARATVRHGNSAAKQAAVAAIPAVIREGKQIGYEQNWQGRGYDTYVFAAPVEINGIKLYQSVIVNSYLHDNRRAFYVHEVCWTDGSFVTMDSAGKPTKKEDTSTQLSRSVLSLHSETQKVSSEQSIAQTSDESKRTDEPVKKTVRYSINPEYAKNIDSWDRNGRARGQSFILGRTGDTLQQLGAKERSIYMLSDKINTILKTHPEMTLEEIKRIPEVLDNPTMVLTSQNKMQKNPNTRLVMFGSVKAQDGRPVLCVLDLMPREGGIIINDMQKLTSAYTKDVNPAEFVRSSDVLYVSENKEKTTALMQSLGFKVPVGLQRYGSIGSIAYAGQNVKLKGVKFAELEEKSIRYQRAEQADRDAKQNQQRQASRVLAEKAAAFDTLNQFFGLTKNTRLSDAALESLAIRWTKTNGSRADRTKLAKETRALVEYLRSDGADMAKAQGLAETLAGEVLDEATYRNTELWNQYPDLHDLTYTVDKNGKAKAELVNRYGSWTEAVAEARRHGVKLRQAEGYRDGNPAEQYEAIVNDTRAVGGVKESAAALFRSAAQQAGVAGAASMESTEWLDVLMNVHDTIKPKMMSRFADVAEYEDAKVELAGRMIGDIMGHKEMTDAEAVFEGILRHNREVAAMAAGSEERADEVTKGLKSVQQAQRKAFSDRMRTNSRSQSAEAKSVSRAEQQLNENLETLGAPVSTAAGLDEKMTALREAYEREWKAERKRLADARQEMLDEIALERQEMRSQINDLAAQVAGEQQRADYAEHQLIYQQNEMMEWAVENNRKKAEWKEKQAERNKKARELAKQHREEDAARAKALAEKRVQKARDGRKADELRRSIRNNAAQLNQMVLRPKPGKYVQQSLIVQAAEVAKLADMAVLNNNAVAKLTALQDSIRRSGEMDAGIHADWENSGVENLIQTLRDDMNASKQAKLDRLNKQLKEAEALPDGDKAEQLRDRLRQRIRETENRTYLPMTVDQLRMLKAITASTLHIIRTENKTLSLARAEEVDSMAMKAAHEVLNSEGNGFGEKFEKAKGAMNRYQLDMLGGTRMFRRLGGYTKNGQMEKLGQMLNDGQRRQSEILVEGESLFANVTGKEHLKEVEAFAGPGAKLVDIGLKDSRGAVPLNHAQLCSLYMLLRNEDSRHHLMTGGLTLPDAAQYAKGNIERAYQRSQTVMLGTLVNADGVPMADTILQTVQDAMTDYDRAWCEDMKDFFGRYTTNLINETSMKLLGYNRATVKNYYPIAVDRSTLATEIEGVKMDATIEGRGFLKERVKSDKPILLEECQNVVKRSLRDTAAYAGLAAPIRDVQRVLNSTVETAESVGVLKNKIIKDKWGADAVSYIDELLTDLQQVKKISRKTFLTPMLTAGRGLYAGAVLTLNPGVAIAQAASLPTAGAVLGADTMAAVLPFVKNFSGKQRAALEAEIRQHGDALLQYRLRGTKQGELSSVGANMGLVKETMSKMPHLTGWITGMDEITVAALWEGAKRYVEHHAAEFGEGAAEKGSEAYWEAVNKMYQRVIEETQPNYTAMQRAGIQRNDSDVVRGLTMFTTQRFQNYGILADAVGDYKAQKARYDVDQSAENKAEKDRAGRDLKRAVSSQAVQTAVFAAMKIISDFLLRRWDREQDENGDVTGWSLLKRYGVVCVQAVAGYAMGGSEIYSFVDNVIHDTDYDVISISSLAGANDAAEDAAKFSHELAKDTSEMDEEELEKHHGKLKKCALTVIKDSGTLVGLPAQNAFNLATAIWGWGENIVYGATKGEYGKAFSINGLPASATGQYDRLYNAIQSGDSEEAAAAMKKLEQMGKTDKVDSQLKTRLKQYDADVLAAAKAQNAGKEKAAETARQAAFKKLLDGLDVGSKDSARRTELVNVVTGAVNEKANELLLAEKGRNKDASVYADLLDEVENGRVKDAQAEIGRLLGAGKKKSSIKTKITDAVKEEYLAGSDGDRERLEKKLLALEDADGNALYEEKNFAQWVSAADKKAEKAKDEKNWWDGVK